MTVTSKCAPLAGPPQQPSGQLPGLSGPSLRAPLRRDPRRVSQMRLSPVRPDQPGLSSEPQAPPTRALVQAHVPASPSPTSPRGPLRCACLTEPGGGTGILAFQSGARGLVHGTSLGHMPLSRGLKGPPPHVELFRKVQVHGTGCMARTSWDTRALAEMLDLSGHPHTRSVWPRCVLKASGDPEIVTCFLHSFDRGK